jgi:hypothetical protein
MELELICDSCHDDLAYEVHFVRDRIRLYIKPCETCYENKFNEGKNEGYEQCLEAQELLEE